ncbi:hypothetical protein BH11VER1_BH11VER1_26520 [soil metagenome]
MKSHIDSFAAETIDESEWVLAGWAFVSGSIISSGCLILDGVPIGPISCNWPRKDVLEAFPSECPSEKAGFMAHIFLPPGTKPGVQTLDLRFFDENTLEIGRIHQQFTVSKEIPNVINAYPPLDAAVDTNAHEYLDDLERNLMGLPEASGPELQLRQDGRDWPSFAHTMIGLDRLHHLRLCAETIMRENVPGDFIETGVWRGGACIMMRGVLHAFNDKSRNVWVADSFQGLPQPNDEKYPADLGDNLYTFKELAIPLEQVRGNFAHYGLLDSQVKFMKGWFSVTLPTAPIHQLAILRLDGDMYESTMDALTHLYPKLSPGGFCIIDDYGCIPACRAAVRDYRKSHGITEPMSMIDWTGAFWRKESAFIDEAVPMIPPLSPNNKILKDPNILHSDVAPSENQKSNPSMAQLAEGLPLGRLALREPQYLHPSSAWLEHIPFALWLVEHHRPKIIVELGVHTGPSYCAFCQAVLELRLDSKCYGIDTFGGDLHAGYYDSSILAELRAYHDPRYAKFSTLVQSSFENALEQFEDGTIDLLHIDGLHHYEAVRHDFESWLPKLSHRAIVLFHDTRVHERDFGVFRLWAELQTAYPSFEFFHEHGLGVLAVGKQQTPDMEGIFSNTNKEHHASIREFFSVLGVRLRLKVQLEKIPALERELDALNETSFARAQELSTLQNQQVLLQAGLTRTTTSLNQTKVELASSQNEFTASQNKLAVSQDELTTLHLQHDHLRVESKVKNRAWRASVAGQQLGYKRVASEIGKLREIHIRKSFKSRLVASFPWFKGRKLRQQCRQITRAGLFDSDYYVSQLPVGFKVKCPLVHYLSVGWKAGLSPHPLFDASWYKQQYTKKLKGREPLTDFLQSGWKKKQQPHPLFDVEWYVQRYPDSAEKDRNPLSDYIRYAVCKKRWPHPLFDGAWYVKQYGAELAPGQTPLEHYLHDKNTIKHRPNPLLDTKWYAREYMGTNKAGTNPLLHYLEVGAKCGLEPNPLFDSGWYASQQSSIKKSSASPLAHFLHIGASKNLNPSPLFKTSWYAQQYQHFIKDKMNPLAHYLVHGLALGCKPNPQLDAAWYLDPPADNSTFATAVVVRYLRSLVNRNDAVTRRERPELDTRIMQTIEPWFDRDFYLSNNPDIACASKDPLEHYHFHGEREGRSPCADFDPNYYLETNIDVRLTNMECAGHPFFHFVSRGKKEGRSGKGFIKPFTLREAALPSKLTPGSVGVAVHLFYPDVWEKIQAVLSRLPSQTRLYISLVEGHSDHLSECILREHPTARIQTVQNRGRDVAPFLTQLRAMQEDGVTVALKIHGKKSAAHLPCFGDVWRDALYEDLAPTVGHVNGILDLFQSDLKVGLVIPEAHCASLLRGLENNRAGLGWLASALGVPLPEEQMGTTPFPAGTMFWFRPAALLKLSAINLKHSHFPEEAGQLDGTLAHAIERIVGIVTSHDNFKTIAYRWKLQSSTAGSSPTSPVFDVPLRARLEKKYPGFTQADGLDRAKDLLFRDRTPCVTEGPERTRPRMNFLFQDLNPDIVYGGYIAGLEFAAAMSRHFDIRFVLGAHPSQDLQGLRKKFQSNPQVGPMLELAEWENMCRAKDVLTVGKSDFFCAFSSWDCLLASKLARACNQPGFLYFCQEDETSFHSHDAYHAMIAHARTLPQLTIFNTMFLREHFRTNRLGVYAHSAEFGDENSIVFDHALTLAAPATVEAYRSRGKTRILVYARPESHARRNLFEHAINGLGEFLRTAAPSTDELEIIGVGTLGCEEVLPLGNGHEIRIMPRLEMQNYAESLATFDIGLSLMYAPHPGVVHFEMAAAGMLVVTNTYGVRTAARLTAISPNLIPVTPSVSGVAAGLLEAWQRRKNYDERIQGAAVKWKRSWDEAFDEAFTDKITTHVSSLLAHGEACSL